MDEVIAHATQIINQQLEWYSSKLSNIEKFQLIETRDLLRQLLNCDPYRNKWIWLYGRQFERLLNQNERPPNDFWIQLHDDILFVLEELNGTKNKNDSWTSFLGKMKFEDELCNCQWRLCFTCLTYSPGTNPLSLCSCYIMCGRSFLYIRCVQCREGTAESVQMTQYTIMSKDIGASHISVTIFPRDILLRWMLLYTCYLLYIPAIQYINERSSHILKKGFLPNLKRIFPWCSRGTFNSFVQ